MDIKKKVADYYTDKITRYGANSRGVDWNSEESQILRFEQLAKLLPQNKEEPFSVLDYGCGYGALVDFLESRYQNVMYTGYDLSEEMLRTAVSLHPQKKFTNKEEELDHYDYVIASGIFNVKLDTPQDVWQKYILESLAQMNQLSVKGFAFNVLTSYSDVEYMKDYLYYADPLFYFDYCKRNFSRNVALLHDYELYEFTILVRKK